MLGTELRLRQLVPDFTDCVDCLPSDIISYNPSGEGWENGCVRRGPKGGASSPGRGVRCFLGAVGRDRGVPGPRGPWGGACVPLCRLSEQKNSRERKVASTLPSFLCCRLDKQSGHRTGPVQQLLMCARARRDGRCKHLPGSPRMGGRGCRGAGVGREEAGVGGGSWGALLS